MKKIFLLIALPFVLNEVAACDICGGPGSSYMGLLPQFRKRFVGLRYQQNGLRYHLGPGGSDTYLTTRENYRTMELWGAANLGTRFRLSAFVPFSFIERTNLQEFARQQGLGDMTVIAYYRLFTAVNADDKTAVNQSLWLGAGLKLPTGEYDPAEKNITRAAQNTFQLGTGSIDYSLHAMYDVSVANIGFNGNASYKINTRNRYDYRYGNKFTMNMLAYYRAEVSNTVSLTPNAGVLYENAGKDRPAEDVTVWESGGRCLNGTLGLELAVGKFSAGANFQTPLSQHLGEGKLKAGDRGMVHFSVSF